MARGKAYSAETRAAVLTALLAGQGVSDVSRAHDVSPATVRLWKRTAQEDGLTEFTPKKGADIGDLVARYLRELLQTLAVQQRHFRSEAWLGQQSAADLAVLHGVSADKAFRILEAIRPADGAENDGGAGADGH